MPPAMASSQLEMTISVFSPRLTNTGSSHNIVIGAGAGWSIGAWEVTLRLLGPKNCNLSITWNRPEKQNFIQFLSMHVISRADVFIPVKSEKVHWRSFDARHTHAANFLEASVLIGDKYDFDVVFSTEAELLRTTSAPAPAPVILPKKLVPQPTSSSKEKSLISLLLKDPSTVDVCFTSTYDKTYSSIGIWAHRFLLSQHKSFAKAIQDAIMVQALGDMVLADTKSAEDVDSDLESTSNLSVDTAITQAGAAQGMSVGAASKELFIKVDTISLATICVVLYYIYTGEIDRTVDATRFVLSDTNKVSLVWRDSAGKVEDSVDWRPLGQGSPWRLKEVTWIELRGAAIHFELKDLQAVAERNLL